MIYYILDQSDMFEGCFFGCRTELTKHDEYAHELDTGKKRINLPKATEVMNSSA